MKRKSSKKKATEPDNNSDPNLLTFGGHLEVLRRMLFRIIAVVMALAIAVFCFKDKTFERSLLQANGILSLIAILRFFCTNLVPISLSTSFIST